MSIISSIVSKLGLTGKMQNGLLWQQFGSYNASGIANNPTAQLQKGYENNIDVFAMIKRITDTLKSVPDIVEIKQNNKWDAITDTSIHELWASPNVSKGFTWDDIQEQRLIYLLSTGDNYLIGNTQIDRVLIEELDILPPSFVMIKTNGNFFNPEIKYSFEIGSNKKEFEKSEIQHTKFFNPMYSSVNESFNGLSMIQVASMAVRVGSDRWEADANLLQNRGAIGLISDKSDRPMTANEAHIVQQAFDRDTAGIANFGKIKVTNKDLNYIQMAMSSADLQLLEKGVVTLRSVCNVFGLDSSLFNDPANKTFNNRKEAEKALYTNVLMPLAKKISEQDTTFIANNHFPKGNVRIRKDFSSVEALQTDFNKQADTLVKLKNAGIFSANEAREKLGKESRQDNNADNLIISQGNVLLSSLDK